jgi:hypothetical protein
MPLFEKDPDATSSYQFDWTAWLAGDTISTSAWAELPSDLTVVSTANTTLTATIVVSGGTPGRTYRLRNRITTASALIQDQTAELLVLDQ